MMHVSKLALPVSAPQRGAEAWVRETDVAVLPRLHNLQYFAVVLRAHPNLPRSARLRASEQRDRAFASGRHCAAQALRKLGASTWDEEIPVGMAGEPLWPRGYTGSIAHGPGFAAASAGRLDDFPGIGIDIEPIPEASRARTLSIRALHASETRLRAPGMDQATLATLLLSAKHSLFKCLYPIVRVRFAYLDTVVRSIDARAGFVVIELRTRLAPGYPRGRSFTVPFVIHNRLVGTACCVTNEQQQAVD